jgi:hypothetical protein
MDLISIVMELNTHVDADNRSEFLDWFQEHVVDNPEDTILWHVAQEPEMARWRLLCSYVWKDMPTKHMFTNRTRERIYRDMKVWLLDAIRANYIVE